MKMESTLFRANSVIAQAEGPVGTAMDESTAWLMTTYKKDARVLLRTDAVLKSSLLPSEVQYHRLFWSFSIWHVPDFKQ